VSGNRWSARVEGRPRPERNDKIGLDPQIDPRFGECERQSWRCGSQCMMHGAGDHANGAKQIGGATVLVALSIIRRVDGGYLRGRPIPKPVALDCMDVTKRQTEIDGERDQRKPRTTPDMVTKPAHHRRVEIKRGQFSQRSKAVN